MFYDFKLLLLKDRVIPLISVVQDKVIYVFRNVGKSKSDVASSKKRDATLW